MKNKIELLGGAIDRIIGELQNTTTLALGTHKTVEKLPGYKEAIDELTKEFAAKKEENKDESI